MEVILGGVEPWGKCRAMGAISGYRLPWVGIRSSESEKV